MLTVNWDTASVFGKCDPDQVRTGSRSSSPGLISRRAPGFSFCSLQGVLTSVFTLSHPTQCSRLGITAVYFQDSLCQNLASDTSGKKKTQFVTHIFFVTLSHLPPPTSSRRPSWACLLPGGTLLPSGEAAEEAVYCSLEETTASLSNCCSGTLPARG